MRSDASDVAALRRFTRFYTRQAELLDEGLLDSPFTLTEARVLYEVATRGPLPASEIGRDLGLDAGYLSRILTSFSRRGLLSRAADPADGRRALLSLTESGRAAFAPLDDASTEQASRILGGLGATERTELRTAMGRIERLLGRDGAAAVTLRPHRAGDMGWITHRHGVLYAAEYGLDGSFEALVGEITAAFLRGFDPARERCWVAERDGAIVGSVFLVRADDAVAKLRLLYVEPDARGTGLGARLVDECVAFARTAGYRRVVLWTNDVLKAARHIYERAGFVLGETERHRSFGRDLIGETWTLDLDAGPRPTGSRG